MRKRERAALTAALIGVDAFTVAFALLTAYYVRIGSGLLRYPNPEQFQSYYIRMTVIAVPIFLAIYASTRLYDPHHLLGGLQEYGYVIRGSTFGLVALMVLSFWERTDLLSRKWLLIAWLLLVVLMMTNRFLFRRIIYLLRRRGLFVTRTIVIGANEQAKAIVRQLHESLNRGIRVVGFLDDYLRPGTIVLDGLEILGSPSELDLVAEKTGVGGVVVVPDALAWESFQELMRKAASRRNDFEVRLSPGFYEILTTGVTVDSTTFVPLLVVDQVRITGIDAVLKHSLDLGLGTVMLVALAPLMAIVALALWHVQGRPILDRHTVLGLGGLSFVTFKFRTGFLGSARRSLAQPLPANLTNMGPTTWLGTFLYRTGLDKLPQLLNVLRGQMSLVGPRTISAEGSGTRRLWLSSILTVKPGMTGPWAVRSVPTLDDEVRLTLYYVRNWTIWLDLQILFMTARRVLGWIRLTEYARRRETEQDMSEEPTSQRSGVLDAEEMTWTELNGTYRNW